MQRPSDPRNVLSMCSAFVALIVLTATSAQASQAPPRAAFFSSVQPENPTEADTVSVVSLGYFLFSSQLVDSTFSRSGTAFSVGFTALRDTLQSVLRIDRSRSLGRLAAGTYEIVTVALHIDTALGGGPDTSRYVDTTSFTVYPANASPPRVVGTRVSYGSTVGNHPLAYYYWNGDTLSIAVVLIHDDMPAEFTSRVGWSNDTLVLTLVDTTLRSHRMPAGYVAVSSIASIKPGSFPVRIRYERRSARSPFKTPSFHELTIDNTREALALSIKTPGAAEFTLFPVDTELNGYSYFLASPFLDAVNLLSFQPNPSCFAPKHPSLFVGDVYADGYDLVEDWESYRAGAWTSVSMQQSDRFAYDTINADGNHWLRITYSNDANAAVKSSVYRSLDSAIPVSSHTLRLEVSFISPVVSSVRRSGTAHSFGVSGLRVRVTPASVVITSPPQAGVPDERARFLIVDLHGRAIRTLNPNAAVPGVYFMSSLWDCRDTQGNRVPPGVYTVKLSGRTMPPQGGVAVLR